MSIDTDERPRMLAPTPSIGFNGVNDPIMQAHRPQAPAQERQAPPWSVAQMDIMAGSDFGPQGIAHANSPLIVISMTAGRILFALDGKPTTLMYGAHFVLRQDDKSIRMPSSRFLYLLDGGVAERSIEVARFTNDFCDALLRSAGESPGCTMVSYGATGEGLLETPKNLCLTLPRTRCSNGTTPQQPTTAPHSPKFNLDLQAPIQPQIENQGAILFKALETIHCGNSL